MSGVEGADESAEGHVQGCGEENRSKEKQGRLQDIWDKFARGIVCQCPANISYCLDCKCNQPWLRREGDFEDLQIPPTTKGRQNHIR